MGDHSGSPSGAQKMTVQSDSLLKRPGGEIKPRHLCEICTPLATQARVCIVVHLSRLADKPHVRVSWALRPGTFSQLETLYFVAFIGLPFNVPGAF